MGLDVNGLRLLLLAKRLGANFKEAVTIGRQGMHLTPAQLQSELSRAKISCKDAAALIEQGYCEPLLSLLGADDPQSIDFSGYENAKIIHDMNIPLPGELKGKFSVVIDAGTLEHVFNYPVALKNSMELLATGGFFISITPTNNFMGHGFYQISPELFFAAFKEANGFEIVKLLVREHYEDSQWYEVSKPKGGIHGRITLTNHTPTYLMCIARRLDANCVPFASNPQQSDYVDAWGGAMPNREKIDCNRNAESFLGETINGILKSVPGLRTIIRGMRYVRRPVFPRRDFIPFADHGREEAH